MTGSTCFLGPPVWDTKAQMHGCRTNDGSSVSLSTFKGKNPVVLFFYPKAATPGCTKEVRGGRR